MFEYFFPSCCCEPDSSSTAQVVEVNEEQYPADPLLFNQIALFEALNLPLVSKMYVATAELEGESKSGVEAPAFVEGEASGLLEVGASFFSGLPPIREFEATGFVEVEASLFSESLSASSGSSASSASSEQHSESELPPGTQFAAAADCQTPTFLTEEEFLEEELAGRPDKRVLTVSTTASQADAKQPHETSDASWLYLRLCYFDSCCFCCYLLFLFLYFEP
ncbi:unnamed protein product [Polarella glacialis]|uniref:Uncharacterized protein n=1 Tax=Polarella glacialis TaxID=89957 RepID=A0A813H2N3_POLGL|nr:unnamed protein product [Polarella glacialis]